MAGKPNIRSIRFSDEMAELIDRQVGSSFTEKFENLVSRCVWELPEREKQLAKIPSLMNFISMWGIRITTASFLAPRLGLYGVWIAMCGELCIRGVLFLVRLLREKWLDQILIAESISKSE